MENKIIRTICVFTATPNANTLKQLETITQQLKNNNFEVQTQRICTALNNLDWLEDTVETNPDLLLGIGALTPEKIHKHESKLLSVNNLNFTLELTNKEITLDDVSILFKIIRNAPDRTFNFAYIFNNAASSPYMPSAQYEQDGFSIGLQPTDLSKGCTSLDEWFVNMAQVWEELDEMLKNNKDYLGIDSSIAPLFIKESSLVEFIKTLGLNFSQSFTTDIYSRITKFIKEKNPTPTGLCGLMMPCLEDFELAKEYEEGNFTIERNTFVSLHSGLGIDTYPIGTDERPDRVLEILKLVQTLSNKYNKPLSARFVSDGKAKIGERTDFRNQYLYDVIVRQL